MAFKKILLNLDEDTYDRFQQIYGRTLGVSKAMRALMQNHLKLLAAKKEAQQKDHLDDRNIPTELTESTTKD